MNHETLQAEMDALREKALAAVVVHVKAAQDQVIDLFLEANRDDEEYEDDWDNLPVFTAVTRQFRHYSCRVLCLAGAKVPDSDEFYVEVVGMDDDDEERDTLLNDLSLPELIDILRWLETNDDIFERP